MSGPPERESNPVDDATAAARKPALKLPIRQLLIAIGLAATVYAAALLIGSGDAQMLQQALTGLLSVTGLQAAALCLASYLLRGTRWRMWMAHYGRPFGWRQGLRLYLAGYAFTPTPGNIGEASRGLMLASRPLGARQSLAIFGAERLADLLCLLLLCLPALAWLPTRSAGALTQMPSAWLASGIAAALALLVLAGALLLRRLWNRPDWQRRLAWLKQPWLQEAWVCLAVRPSVWITLTLTAWAAQGLAMWLICRDAGLDLPVLVASGYYAIAMVAGALSALPAGLGGTEAVLAGLLMATGASAGPALAITVLVRLLTLWFAVALGVLALFYSSAIRRDISLR